MKEYRNHTIYNNEERSESRDDNPSFLWIIEHRPNLFCSSIKNERKKNKNSDIKKSNYRIDDRHTKDR